MWTPSPQLASPSEKPILTQDPKAAVEKLYQHFEWTMSDASRARLAQQPMVSASFKVSMITRSKSSRSRRNGSKGSLVHY